MQRLEELEKQILEKKMQQEQEKKVIFERQTKLHSELHKIKKSNEDVASGAPVQGETSGSVRGSNGTGQPISQSS